MNSCSLHGLQSNTNTHSHTQPNTEVENALEQVMPEESRFFHGNVKAVLLWGEGGRRVVTGLGSAMLWMGQPDHRHGRFTGGHL